MTVRARVDAPIERVWQALCEPAEVAAWDGATPLVVPAGYPRPGQHALWLTPVGPFTLRLHDRVVAVDAPHRLAARLTYGLVAIDEEYRLESVPGSEATTITSDNTVRARVPGAGWAARRVTERSVEAALARLARHSAR